MTTANSSSGCYSVSIGKMLPTLQKFLDLNFQQYFCANIKSWTEVATLSLVGCFSQDNEYNGK